MDEPYIAYVYRVLEAFSLNATLISTFTTNNNNYILRVHWYSINSRWFNPLNSLADLERERGRVLKHQIRFL